MSDHATKQDLQDLRSELKSDIDVSIDRAVSELSEVIQQLAYSMSEQIKEVKTDIADIRSSIDHLT